MAYKANIQCVKDMNIKEKVKHTESSKYNNNI